MNRVGSAPLDVRLDLQIAETRVWTLKSRKHRRRTPFEVQEAPEVLRFGRIGNPKAIKKEKSRLREQLVVRELWKELSRERERFCNVCVDSPLKRDTSLMKHLKYFTSEYPVEVAFVNQQLQENHFKDCTEEEMPPGDIGGTLKQYLPTN